MLKNSESYSQNKNNIIQSGDCKSYCEVGYDRLAVRQATPTSKTDDCS